MDELLARSESERLISAAALDLEGQAAAKRMNHFVAKLLGAIANALDYREIADRVQSLLMALTAEDFFKASITNIDLHRLSANELDRLREIEPLESFNRTHPVYVRNQAVPDVQRFASALDHLKPCLNGDVATAVAIANSELEFEDIADTLAALGKRTKKQLPSSTVTWRPKIEDVACAMSCFSKNAVGLRADLPGIDRCGPKGF